MTAQPVKHKYLFSLQRAVGRAYFVRAQKGGRALRLTAPPGSADFWPQYGRLVEQSKSAAVPINPTTRAGRHKVRQLVQAYLDSREFARFRPATQKNYKSALTKISGLFGGREFGTLARQDIRLAMDEMPIYAANQFLQVFRQLNDWCDQRGFTVTFPAAGIKAHGKSRTGFPAWSQVELDRYLITHVPGTQARLMIDLLRFTGMRVADVIELGPRHIRDGFIKKTLVKNNVKVKIPVHPDLADSITAAGDTGATFLTLTRFNRPFDGSDYFGRVFRRYCAAAGISGTAARRAVSGHGLRKFALINVLKAGATTREAQALFGWRDAEMVQHYSEELDRQQIGETRGPALMLGAA